MNYEGDNLLTDLHVRWYVHHPAKVAGAVMLLGGAKK
jgi:hypothetical protein